MIVLSLITVDQPPPSIPTLKLTLMYSTFIFSPPSLHFSSLLSSPLLFSSYFSSPLLFSSYLSSSLLISPLLFSTHLSCYVIFSPVLSILLYYSLLSNSVALVSFFFMFSCFLLTLPLSYSHLISSLLISCLISCFLLSYLHTSSSSRQ